MSELGRYRKLFIGFWLHPGLTELTDSEKLLAVWLLTGPATNRIGLYRLSPAQAAEDLGTSLESFRKRLRTVCTAFGWLFDERSRVLYIPSWWKWNPPANENVVRGSLKDLNEIPACGLVDAFVKNIEPIPEPFREAFLKGLTERSGRASRNQDQYLDHEQKKEQEHRASREALNEGGNADGRAPDDRLMQIATQIRQETPEADADYLIDAVLWLCKQRRVTADRSMAVNALAAASGA